MEVKTWYLYHIKDEFFHIVNDEGLMTNHGRGQNTPTYFTLKDGDILWFIPLSSKIDKYQKIVDRKTKKYGFCNTIIIDEVLEGKAAILIQNAFPTLEKYIDHVHTLNGKPAKVPTLLRQKIISNFESMIEMKEHGTNLFFTDIDRIKNMMEEELYTVNK